MKRSVSQDLHFLAEIKHLPDGCIYERTMPTIATKGKELIRELLEELSPCIVYVG